MNLQQDSTYFIELQTNTGWGRMLKQFAEWCAPQPGWRTLDSGCGPGLFSALMEGMGALAFGSDLDPANFQIPQHTRLCAADACHLPFPSGYFDLVTASNLLFLLPDPPAALRQLARVTRPGGQVCLLNPSDQMSLAAATALADNAGLTGLARDTLLNYGTRAERFVRWTEEDLEMLFVNVGMQLAETKTAMGPGLVRFARGIKSN